MTPNDRGYGLGRAAGEFPVAMATKEMRAQRLQKAKSLFMSKSGQFLKDFSYAKLCLLVFYTDP